MNWESRLGAAVLVSPSGIRTAFDYTDVSRQFDKRGEGYDFPDASGTYVQSLGHTGQRFPLRFIFAGANYDLAADAFEAALREPGESTLEHPLYGVFSVVPLGTVSREDKLVTRAGQAIVEVTLWETTGLVYPTSQSNPDSAARAAVELFNAAQAEEFGRQIDVSDSVKTSALKAAHLANVNRVKESLAFVAGEQERVARLFETIEESIKGGIDLLIAQPVALAMQTLRLVQAPARVGGTIKARLDGYRALINDVLGKSSIHADDTVIASGAVAGAVLSALDSDLETRGEAIRTAETLIALRESVAAWQDNNATTDATESYQTLLAAVAQAAGYLVNESFNLKSERVIILDRARTLIDLESEVYGTVGENLDLLINSNSLAGLEILELQPGRRISYYV